MEKVYDLVEQVREFGPQFKVVVLDVEEEGYDDKLNALTKDAPELRQAIDSDGKQHLLPREPVA